MVDKSVIKKVRAYTRIIRDRFPVKRVILFGSFARGKNRTDSDIDVAVIMKKEPDDILQTEVELFRLRRSIDVRIEPKLVDDTIDLSGFLEEISRYGKIIYSES